MFRETAVWGLVVIVATWWLQWLIVSGVKAKVAGAVPGKVNNDLGPESFIFRAHRTYMNSLETLPISQVPMLTG